MSVIDINIIEDYPAKTIVCRKDSVFKSKFGEHFGNCFPEGFGLVSNYSFEGPIAIFHCDEPPSDEKPTDIECAFFVSNLENDKTFPNPWISRELKGGKILQATYKGSYDNLVDGYSYIFNHIKEKGLKQKGNETWEYYKTDPTTCQPSDWITMINVYLE